MKNQINFWQEFAKQTNGTFKEGYSWRSDSNTIDYKNWKIIFDNYTLWSGKYSTQMTRVVAPITFTDNLNLKSIAKDLSGKLKNFLELRILRLVIQNLTKLLQLKAIMSLK
ncbi:hypothetical protein ACHRVZ_04805 [Flavobacterium sp. FlaQc-57]|uniref:hypothetical protein n=1 Tax=Flavobacterium sp. FlaQc-57 TaxID=3374186 RepID=UPI0037563D5E